MKSFEVINPNKRVVMHTKDKDCVPPPQFLKKMAAAGYKFRLDGKLAAAKVLPNLIERA